MQIAFPPVDGGDSIRVSATTYVTYRRCPAAAGARLAGIFPPDSRASFLGSLAHRMFTRHLTSGPIASEDFVQACREEIGGSALNNKLGPLGIGPTGLASVIEELRGLYERFTRLPGEGFRHAEVSLQHEPVDGVELVGTVDAVYSDALGGHRLVDWKTGDLGQPEDQLLFYALLWTLVHEEPPARVEAVSVRTGERTNSVPSTAQLVEVAGEVGKLVDLMRASWHRGAELPRSGGPWCRHCPLLLECSEGQSVQALLRT